jgi:uncharacterized protein (TIGR03435 family)
MRKLVLATACIVAVGMQILLAQDSLGGKWRTQAPSATSGLDIVDMDLKVDAGKVTGSLTRTDPPGQSPVKIENGTATVDTITFAVKSPDGERTITFTGKLKGREIEFTREAKGTGGGTGFYGLEGPKTLTARRLTSASPSGNAASAARLKFAAASVRLLPPQTPETFFEGPNQIITGDLKCLGADGLMWALRYTGGAPGDKGPNARPARRGRCTTPGVPLADMVAAAYTSSTLPVLRGFPLSPQPFFQLEAVAEDPERVTKGELQQMLRSLLEDRFKARIHFETIERDGYVLTIAKSGIKFKETAGVEPTMVGGTFRLNGKYTMAEVDKLLALLLRTNAIANKTGLTGMYEMKFDIEEIRSLTSPGGANVRGENTDPTGPRQLNTPLPKALEDQLGLHLEPGKVPVQFIVIDNLEMPTEN